MSYQLDAIRAIQQEKAQQWAQELETAKREYEEYLASEDYERDQWEANQDRWEEKARREGWQYTRKPFVSALDRQQATEQEKARQIAFLKAKIAELENEG